MSSATSPISGSPSTASTPGSPGRKQRAANKKIYTNEVNELVKLVSYIPIIYDQVYSKGRNEKATIDFTLNGQAYQYVIGRKEFKDLMRLILSQMKKLPNRAFALSKTRRQTSPNAGFLAPQQFQQAMMEFFTNADIGPYVTGQFVDKANKYGDMVPTPNVKTLQAHDVTPLNGELYFIHPTIGQQQNPLYGIISPGSLTPLFGLHSFYAGMQYPNESSRLSASAIMRQYLGGIMQATIQNDAAKLRAKYPGQSGQIDQAAQQLIQAINNQNLLRGQAVIINGNEMFNPNYFKYGHISRLISNAKVPNTPQQLQALLAQIAQQVPTVYSRLPQFQNAFGPNVNPIAVVLTDQKRIVAVASARKNALVKQRTQERKRQERAAKRAQQQAQQGGVLGAVGGGSPSRVTLGSPTRALGSPMRAPGSLGPVGGGSPGRNVRGSPGRTVLPSLGV